MNTGKYCNLCRKKSLQCKISFKHLNRRSLLFSSVVLDHIYSFFVYSSLFPNGSWTNCVLILPDIFPHCARGQNVATLGIFCKNCLLLPPSCCYSLLRRSLFLPCCQEECQVAGLELLFGRPKSCYHHKSIT